MREETKLRQYLPVLLAGVVTGIAALALTDHNTVDGIAGTPVTYGSGVDSVPTTPVNPVTIVAAYFVSPTN